MMARDPKGGTDKQDAPAPKDKQPSPPERRKPLGRPKLIRS